MDRWVVADMQVRDDFPQRLSPLVHELFEEQVRCVPQAVAVLYGDQTLSYAQLNARANQLARFLIRAGAQAGEHIPVLMPRCAEMLIAQIAVLKSGAVYVPLDAGLPSQRKAFLINDCGARRLISLDNAQDELLASLSVDGRTTPAWINYTQIQNELQGYSAENCGRPCDNASVGTMPAYVMYTSGSTGEPKGVIASHDGISRLVFDNGYAEIDATDCIAHCSNPAFDASTFEVWAALLNGARVLVIPQATALDTGAFSEALIRHGVTVCFQTTALFNQHISFKPDTYASLKYCLFGGEAADPAAARRALQLGRPLYLLNMYGPTEGTVFATTFPLRDVPEDAVSIPIGHPISNTQVYILDGQRRPVPAGEAGEIYIGGKGVALGYLNRPGLTAERFVPDPFAGDGCARLYKTGDLGRESADGAIEFMGRNDNQVKIRGLRIELGEIEAKLKRHDQVKDALVLARDITPGDQHLVAYIVPCNAGRLSAGALRSHLQPSLPEYMVPSAFVMMDRFPLTANGKVDRGALPAPGRMDRVSHLYEAPVNATEKVLAETWQNTLKLERVGRHDNFFELGGHSLQISRVVQSLRASGFTTEPADVYGNPTVAALAKRLVRLDATEPQIPLVEIEPSQLDWIARGVHGGAANIQEIYPLAPLQEGILFHHFLDEHRGDTYVLSLLWCFDSREHLERFISAVQMIIDRHDALRTGFLWDQTARPIQFVCSRAPMQIEELQAAPDPLVQLRDLMRPGIQKIDLRKPPLMNLKVVPQADASACYGLLQFHHLICDHESLDILLEELAAILSGESAQLPQPVPYRNHIARVLHYARTHDAADFFRAKLDAIPSHAAAFDLVDNKADSASILQSNRSLPSELSSRLREQARLLSVSPATLFHAAWALIVARASGLDDVVFGSVLSGRLQGLAAGEQAIGMFINTLPLRIRLAGVSAAELVERTHRELIELLSHEHASLAQAQQAVNIGTTPLFNTLLNYLHSGPYKESENYTVVPGVQIVGFQERTNYPITISVDDQETGFVVTAQTIHLIQPERILDYICVVLRSLVEALAAAPDTAVARLSVLPAEERCRLIGFNSAHANFSQDKLAHELFEEQAERTPSMTAMIYRDQPLSYAQLNARANQVAGYLRAANLGSDDLVGIFMSRGPEMVIALLGILKAGAAYLPLDSGWPRERLAFILEDAAPRMLLTSSRLREQIPLFDGEIVSLDQPPTRLLEMEQGNLGRCGLLPTNLAYLIYTSGSTGTPKGTLIEHRQLLNYLLWAVRTYDPSPGQLGVVSSPLAFDATITSLYCPLLTGGTVFLVEDGREIEDLESLLQQPRDLSVIKISPAHLQLLGERLRDLTPTPPCNVGVFVIGGEALSPATVRLWRSLWPQVRLVNEYGPTETVVGCCVCDIPRDWAQGSTVPIGMPIANVSLYVLDRHLQLAPIGVTGEIYIGGPSVARGYLNRPDLTRDRFIPDPFGTQAGGRLYKTGDLGRWQSNGVLEYLGRNDDQVKIRGFRIELGEIEARLGQHPQVREVAVLARNDEPGEKQLVAYMTLQSAAGAAVNANTMREYLSASLPAYMIPAAFVVLEDFPLTPNGKVDRRALPGPARADRSSREYEPPLGEVEELLAEIWRSVLGTAQVSRHDDFFQLGGHSLSAMQMLVRVRSALSLHMPLAVLFERPSLKSLAEHVGELRSARLASALANGDAELDDLLDQVSSLSQEAALELIDQLRAGNLGIQEGVDHGRRSHR